MKNKTVNKPLALVLAGTVPHIRLIENLKARGYYTVLVDYYENPPARDFADEHIRESTLDQEVVLSIAKERGAALVITTCMDHANVTACFVAEALGLPMPYSYETALRVTNKQLMKAEMIRHGIPTSKYAVLSDVSECAPGEVNFPVVVKPSDSNGSKGVRKACTREELLCFLQDAIRISRNKTAIVEEYKEGREIGMDCFIQNHKAVVLMIKERLKIDVDGDPIQQIRGCIWPAPCLSKPVVEKLQLIAEQIASVFALKNTPLMLQCIIDDDEINVIEFAARFGGGESFRVIERSTGVDIVDLAVTSFLGQSVHVRPHPSPLYYADVFIYSRPGAFSKINGYRTLLKNGILDYLDCYKTEGAEIGRELSSNNRVGVFVSSARTISELSEKVAMAVEAVDVYDINGNRMMRKELYANEGAEPGD